MRRPCPPADHAPLVSSWPTGACATHDELRRAAKPPPRQFPERSWWAMKDLHRGRGASEARVPEDQVVSGMERRFLPLSLVGHEGLAPRERLEPEARVPEDQGLNGGGAASATSLVGHEGLEPSANGLRVPALSPVQLAGIVAESGWVRRTGEGTGVDTRGQEWTGNGLSSETAQPGSG